MTQAIQTQDSAARLYVAFELSASKWKLAVSRGGMTVREVTLEAAALGALEHELAAAKQRFGLAADAPVVSCYEAGRDGFWLHRWLVDRAVANVVVDSSSIDVDRRQRRAKTDRIDARKLLAKLVRYWSGERDVWSVARVPSVAQDDARRLHRELERLHTERTAHRNRLQGLLCLHGIRLPPGATFVADLATARQWDGTPVPPQLQAELGREYTRLALVQAQLREVEAQRAALVTEGQPCDGKVAALMQLRGIGVVGAWVLCHELFGWREFQNRRELGGAVGLTGTPHESGGSRREQGISKSGLPRVRQLLIELAWGWLRWQPDSALSRWYGAKFGEGAKRLRRVGIVALARRLVIDLWRFVEHGVVPTGARLKA
jgi:transposase